MEGLTEKNPLFPRFHRSCLILQGVFAKGSEHRGSSHAQMIDINLRLFSHPPFSLAEIEATASPVECLTLMDIKDIIETTLYITPHRFDMHDFSISVIHDHHLGIKVAPESVKLVKAMKQQKVHLVIQVLKIPFCLP